MVSLLEAHEVHDLNLGDEQEVCANAGIAFTSFPIPDRSVPESPKRTRALVSACQDRLAKGGRILVHCHAGIGRSSMIAACVLTSAGSDPDTAFQRIAAARGLNLPDTPDQSLWVRAFLQSENAPKPDPPRS